MHNLTDSDIIYPLNYYGGIVMKKALKVISLMLVAVLMVMSFAACGSKDDTATGSDTSKEAKHRQLR